MVQWSGMRKMKVRLSAVIWKEGRNYVSLCPELNVSSFGKTAEVALRHLKEAVALYLQDEPVGFISEVEKRAARHRSFTLAIPKPA